MSKSPAEYVREFCLTYGQAVRDEPVAVAPERWMRVRILEEVLRCVRVAVDQEDILEIADALADIVYAAYGSALTHGIDLDAVLAEVHRSNMSKLGEDGKPLYREDGKVLKGPNYSPPDLFSIIMKTE